MKRNNHIKRNKKTLWSKKEVTVLKIIGLVLLLGIMGSVGSLFWQDYKKQQLLTEMAGTELKHSNVCMAGDAIKLKELKVALIDNKEYWVCCSKCAIKIKHSLTKRYAIDPISNKKVDKSKAIIMQHPLKKEKVLYFETKRNFDIYKSEV